jgi:hypothetical protein
MNKRLLEYAFIVLFIMFSSCKDDNVISKKGYIVFDESDFFYFVPVKELNLENSINSFYTSNLERGFQFQSRTIYFDTVYSAVDTFHIDGRYKDYAEELRNLKIVPVLFTYKKVTKQNQDNSIFRFGFFSAKIRGKNISFVCESTTPDIIISIRILKVKKKNFVGKLNEERRVCPL